MENLLGINVPDFLIPEGIFFKDELFISNWTVHEMLFGGVRDKKKLSSLIFKHLFFDFRSAPGLCT